MAEITYTVDMLEAGTRRPSWHGMLCAETCDEIGQRMAEVLHDRYFTVVTCNSYDENSDRFTGIDVTTSQRLREPVRRYHDETIPASLSWTTPRWSMGVHTSARTQQEGREGGPHKFVHFTFERDQVVIDHYAPAGYRLRWIFTVELHDDDRGPLRELADWHDTKAEKARRFPGVGPENAAVLRAAMKAPVLFKPEWTERAVADLKRAQQQLNYWLGIGHG